MKILAHILTLPFILILISCVSPPLQKESSNNCVTTQSSPIHAVMSSSGFTEQWQAEGVYVQNDDPFWGKNPPTVFIAANVNRIVFYGAYQECRQPSITSLDAQTGNVLNSSTLT